MAPARRRGAVTITFHLGASFGLLSAQITNYFTAKISSHDKAFGCEPGPRNLQHVLGCRRVVSVPQSVPTPNS